MRYFARELSLSTSCRPFSAIAAALPAAFRDTHDRQRISPLVTAVSE
jgi:hypothetical protein